MTALTVYQLDHAGLLIGITQADESPLEPGVHHIPAGCVIQRPPEEWPADQWPRWNGVAWQLIPRPSVVDVARAKLVAFLQANPDVQSLLQ